MSDFSNPTAPFAGETDASIRDRMLATIDSSFIKLEGDFIYDMLQPAALEMEKLYQELETQLWQVFPQSATGENLDALAEQFTSLTRNTDETDDAFRIRVLAAMANPVGAGTASDIRRIVAASGITGLGPVGVAPDGTGGAQVFLISDLHTVIDYPKRDEVQDLLDANTPVGATILEAVAASLAVDDDFVLTLNGDASSAQVAAWRTAIAAWFDALAPGQPFDRPAIFRAAGISESRYAGYTFGALVGDYQAAAADETFRASSVTVVV